MTRGFWVGAALLLCTAGLFGCSNTEEGAKQDTENNTAAVKDTADKAAAATDKAAVNAADATAKAAGNVAAATDKAAVNAADATRKAAGSMAGAAQDAGKTTTAALEVTPKVKLAITADKELNDTRNTINVDSKDGVVHLRGTVMTGEMKTRAGNIATKALNELHGTDKLSNELRVTGK